MKYPKIWFVVSIIVGFVCLAFVFSPLKFGIAAFPFLCCCIYSAIYCWFEVKKARYMVEYKKVDENTTLVTVTSDGKAYEFESIGFTDENIEQIRKLKEKLEEKG